MEIEKKIILTESELSEELMSAWVNGWMSKKDKNDDGKRNYAQEKIKDLLKR